MSVDALRKHWRQLDWVEELFYLAVLAAEACTIYPWQRLLSAVARHRAIPLWGLFILLWIPYLIAGWVEQLREDRRQAVVAALVLLTALIAIRLHVYAGSAYPFWDLTWIADTVDHLFDALVVLPQELLTIVVVFVAWWRGIVASRKEYDAQQVWFRFRAGIVILFAYFLITIFGGRTDSTMLILAYFFFGMLSIALASIMEWGGIRHSSLGSKQWVGVVTGSVLGNLALALLLSLVFSRQTVRTVLAWFRPLGRLLQGAAWYLLSMVIYLAWPLVEWLVAWIRQIRSEGLTFNISPLTSPLVRPQEALATGEGSRLASVCWSAFIVLLVGVGLFLVLRALRRLGQQQALRDDVERESLWSEQDLAGDLRSALRQGWDRLRGLAGQLGDRHRRSAASIRKMYASMVDLATEAGYPRQAAQTPYEFCSALYQAFPGGGEAVDAITEAYVRVHYGEVPSTRGEMNQLLGYWEQVQRLVVPRPVQGP